MYLTFKQFLKERNEITPEFILSLTIPKRKPNNISDVEHKNILGLLDLANEINSTFLPKEKEWKQMSFDNKAKFTRLSKEELEIIYSSNDKPTVIKKRNATYIKYDTSAYKEFEKNVEIIDNFLDTLKGFHREALKGNLVIKFVSSGDMKSKAKYKTDKDELWINSKKAGDTKDDYGSLVYVVLHELGHRYLRYNTQKWNYDSQEWVTTRYSMTDSMIGEEKFAELFAMSHWKNKYKEYVDKINKFEGMLK